MNNGENAKRASQISRLGAPHRGHHFSDNASIVRDERLLRTGGERRSMDSTFGTVNECASSRDVTQSSISMSEGEGDADLEGMATRVAELEGCLQQKEGIVEALNAEIDHLRAEASSPNSSQSRSSSIPGRDLIHVYHSKLQEFENAVRERDELIKDLSQSLKQALSSRDTVAQQLNAINTMQLPEGSKILQEKITTLEVTLDEQKIVIDQLNLELHQTRDCMMKMEAENQKEDPEISDYKTQIQQLNEHIRKVSNEKEEIISENCQQQIQYETQVDKIKKDMQVIIDNFRTETEANTVKHHNEMKEHEANYKAQLQKLRMEYEEQIRQQKESNLMQESQHAKELAHFQAQLMHYKKTVESLKLDSANYSANHEKERAELEGNHQRETKSLIEQIKFYKSQVEDMTVKYITANNDLESKESLVHSLEEAQANAASLKMEKDQLKFQLDDLSSRYTASQSLIENQRITERSLSNRLSLLARSISRFSSGSFSSQQNNETIYEALNEPNLQIHIAKLEEKMELEKKLIEKVQSLEEQVRKAQEELETANLTKKSYEKQLKDMKNLCDKLGSQAANVDSTTSQEQSKSPVTLTSIINEVSSSNQERLSQQIDELKNALKQRDQENAEYSTKIQELVRAQKKLQAEAEKLRHGLAVAWSQCSEFNQSLNQSLCFNDSSKFEDSLAPPVCNPSSTMDFWNTTKYSRDSLGDASAKSEKSKKSKAEDCEMPLEVSRLLETQSLHGNMLKQLEDEKSQVLQEFQTLKENSKKAEQQLKALAEEKDLLMKDLSKLEDKHKEEMAGLKINSATENQKLRSLLLNVKEGNAGMEELRNELEACHAKEMEELRTYFEQKCLQMEKQYSEEIFSQQSKKMSEDSEIEELTDDLYFGGDVELVSPRVNDDKAKVSNGQEEQNVSKIITMYEEQVQTLKGELADMKNKCGRTLLLKTVNESCQTEWDQNQMENSELTKLRDNYSHQLEEQVTLARLDIVNALQDQIQALLVIDSDTEENWPTELLELRNKFTNNAKREIQELKEKHCIELMREKENHSRAIEGYNSELITLKTAIENSERDFQIFNIKKNELLQERDRVSNTCAILKRYMEEFVKYVKSCEEEVNNTLIAEVLRRQDSDMSNSRIDDSCINKGAITFMESPEWQEGVGDGIDTRTSSKSKRVHFAPRLVEISQIVNSDNTLQDLMNLDEESVTKLKTKLKSCLVRFRNESAQILGISSSASINDEPEINSMQDSSIFDAQADAIKNYRKENEQLKIMLAKAQQKLFGVESNKEIVSEGYGEQDQSCEENTSQELSHLLDRAKAVIMNGSVDNAYIVQIVDELCRHIDKLSDDSKREKEDLQKQVEAADKQLRATRKFLEEQASEREAERDDAAKQIKTLQQHLKGKEREKERDLRISSESSLSPVSSLVTSELQASENDETVDSLECQLRKSVSQISQLEKEKSRTESELKATVDKIWVLRDIINEHEQQVQARDEREEALQSHINELEEIIAAQTKNQQDLAQELEAIKTGSENVQLNEHITHLQEELRKHQLSSEHFNVNSSALKQMKVQLREMQSMLDKRTKELESLHVCGSNLSLSQPSEDVSIREQIDAARCPTPDDPNSPPTLPLDQILRLKDKLLKHGRAEEVALKRIKDLEMQLTAVKAQNEELQAEQDILQQTASEQLFQIETMRGRLEQQKQNAPFIQKQVTSRLELQLHEANSQILAMERTIADKELEISELRRRLERTSLLLSEKESEISKVVAQENNTIQKLRDQLEVIEEEKKILQAKVGTTEQEQIDLIDSMLADKNEEIDHLKDQLGKKEKILEEYLSQHQEEVVKQNLEQSEQPKISARTLSDILSINSECEDIPEAIRDSSNFMQNMQHQQNHRETSSLKIPNSREMSHSIFSQVEETAQVPQLELDSNSHSSHGHQFYHVPSYTIDNMEMGSKSLSEVDGSSLHVVSRTNDNIQQQSASYNVRSAATSPYPRTLQQIQELENQLENLTKELVLKSQTMQSAIAQVEILRGNEEAIDSKLQETTKDLKNLVMVIEQKDTAIENGRVRVAEVEKEIHLLNEYRSKFESCRGELEESHKEILRLTEGVNNRDFVIRRLEEMARRSSLSGESSPNEDVNKNEEIHHLQEHIKEKDKVIQQMSDDSKSLHKALETIQNKIKESGNIVQLRKKLKEEKSVNRELRETVEKLKAEWAVQKISMDEQQEDEESDIEDMVQRELNVSAHLDRQIMNVIDSEPEGVVMKRMQTHSCNSLTISPLGQGQNESIMSEYSEVRSQLKQANKMNNELKRAQNELEIEKQVLKSQVAEYENRILQLKSDLEEETKRAVSLEKELSKERNAHRTLQIRFTNHQDSINVSQQEDAELISSLRKHLTASLEVEENLRTELTNLRQEYKNLEIQARSMQDQLQNHNASNAHDKTLDHLMEEQKKCVMLMEKCDKEERNNTEMKITLKRLETEKSRLKEHLELVTDEKESLISKLTLVECEKDEMKDYIDRLKAQCKSKDEECGWLQNRIKVLSDADGKRRQQISDENGEILSLQKQLDSSSNRIRDLEHDVKQLKETLNKSQENERRTRGSFEKEVEVNKVLSAMRNNTDVASWQEEHFSGKPNSSSKYLHEIKELKEQIVKASRDNTKLKDKLLETREERDRLITRFKQLRTNEEWCPAVTLNQEADERLQYFYGKFLRSDSRRKALVYQKRYLLCILAGYQRSEENTLAMLSRLTQIERACVNQGSNRKSPLMRFRSAAKAIISIHRMKWLIVRWRSGRKVGTDVVFGNLEKSFVSSRKVAHNHSPPVQDTPSNKTTRRDETNFGLEHYLHRFENVHRNLSSVLNDGGFE